MTLGAVRIRLQWIQNEASVKQQNVTPSDEHEKPQVPMVMVEAAANVIASENDMPGNDVLENGVLVGSKSKDSEPGEVASK
jgi:hypothetical protein